MKSSRLLFTATALAVAATALSGCATKRYGRMDSIVPAEEAAYDCRQIAIEIAKVEGFELKVEQGANIDWKSVAGFLGDYGIGNAMEKNEALKSAKERKAQLRALEAKKGCMPGGAPQAMIPQPAVPAPTQAAATTNPNIIPYAPEPKGMDAVAAQAQTSAPPKP